MKAKKLPSIFVTDVPPIGTEPWRGENAFVAFTKGEARALAKREFGIPAKGRLPVGTTLRRVAMASR